MQRHAGPANIFYQRFAARLKFFQIRWAKWFVGRSRKNDVGHLEVAHGPVIRRRKRVDLFCDAERCLPGFIVRPDIADDGWINRISEDDQRIVSGFNRVSTVRKCARHDNERIGRADKKAVLFQSAEFGAQFCDRIAQVAFA